MGKPAARVGDMHTCPMVTPGVPPVPHVGGPILPPGCPTVLIGGMPAARSTDICTCVGPPDPIAIGSTGVFIGGLPAARMGDMTTHGGVITVGLPTVMIGETMPGAPPVVTPPIVIVTLSGSQSSGSGTSSQATQSAMHSAPPAVIPVLAQKLAFFEAAEAGVPFCKKCQEEKNKEQ